MLEGSAIVPNHSVSEAAIVSDAEMKGCAMWEHFQHKPEQNVSGSLTQSLPTDGPWNASTSASDLYPIILDSDFWEKRA